MNNVETEPFGWIKSSEVEQSSRYGGSINLWREKYDCDIPVYVAAQHKQSSESGPPGSGGWESYAKMLEQERDHWRTRVQMMNDHADGECWFWQGDGEDHLESMCNSLSVVIRADQLRQLVASSQKQEQYKMSSAYDRYEQTESSIVQRLCQLPVTPETRARTLLAHLWRVYDAAGVSMGRTHEAVVLEAAMKLLGDPDPLDMQRLDDVRNDLIGETRSYLSAIRARNLGLKDKSEKRDQLAAIQHNHQVPQALANDAADLLFALQDAWPYVHRWCTINSKKEKISALLRKHGEFADFWKDIQQAQQWEHDLNTQMTPEQAADFVTREREFAKSLTQTKQKPTINWTVINRDDPSTFPANGYWLVTVDTDDGREVHVLLHEGDNKWEHEGEYTFKHSYYFRPIAWAPCPDGYSGEISSE